MCMLRVDLLLMKVPALFCQSKIMCLPIILFSLPLTLRVFAGLLCSSIACLKQSQDVCAKLIFEIFNYNVSGLKLYAQQLQTNLHLIIL